MGGGMGITSQLLPPTGFIVPFVPFGKGGNFSEGLRLPKSFGAPSSKFNYQPSFTALVREMRGGDIPGRIPGGYDPTVFRTLNPRKRRRGRKRKK
jgi:hypothetical protein